jgi:hypothetical protein
MIETSTILRGILFDAMLAELDGRGVDFIIRSISAVCQKDDIAAVKEQIGEEIKAREAKENK